MPTTTSGFSMAIAKIRDFGQVFCVPPPKTCVVSRARESDEDMRHTLAAIVIIGISASPMACPLRGYGRVGTQNDRLGGRGGHLEYQHAHTRATDMPSAVPTCISDAIPACCFACVVHAKRLAQISRLRRRRVLAAGAD